MKKRPNYAIVEVDENNDGTINHIVLRDVGLDGYPTISNGAEEVISDLHLLRWLTTRPRVLYYDSEGRMDTELLYQNSRFLGFAALPKEEHRQWAD